MVYTLHKIGAKRCDNGHAGCTDGCSFDGKYNGKKILTMDKAQENIEKGRSCHLLDTDNLFKQPTSVVGILLLNW